MEHITVESNFRAIRRNDGLLTLWPLKLNKTENDECTLRIERTPKTRSRETATEENRRKINANSRKLVDSDSSFNHFSASGFTQLLVATTHFIHYRFHSNNRSNFRLFMHRTDALLAKSTSYTAPSISCVVLSLSNQDRVTIVEISHRTHESSTPF